MDQSAPAWGLIDYIACRARGRENGEGGVGARPGSVTAGLSDSGSGYTRFMKPVPVVHSRPKGVGGRVVRRGTIRTFHDDNGKAWNAEYKLDGGALVFNGNYYLKQ
jgi:hypothetical protein